MKSKALGGELAIILEDMLVVRESEDMCEFDKVINASSKKEKKKLIELKTVFGEKKPSEIPLVVLITMIESVALWQNIWYMSIMMREAKK